MLLDILIAIPIIWGLVRGLMKGIISEVMAILAIILGVMGARYWGVELATWIHSQYQWQDTVCRVLAYALLFIGIAVALSIMASLLSRLFKAIHLGGINRLLGGVFGMLKWGIIVLVVLFCIEQLDRSFEVMPKDLKTTSKLYPIGTNLAEQVFQEITNL